MSPMAFLHTTLHTPLELAHPTGRQLIGATAVEVVEPIGIAVERSETFRAQRGLPTTSWLQSLPEG
jgi:hypothetical protein